jgi:hypothetical protein
MNNSNTNAWLIDSSVVVGLTGIAVFFLPWVSACCAALSLHLGRTRVLLAAVGDLLPHLIVGCFLGLVAAWLIRHRKLSLALLPSILVCVFYALTCKGVRP